MYLEEINFRKKTTVAFIYIQTSHFATFQTQTVVTNEKNSCRVLVADTKIFSGIFTIYKNTSKLLPGLLMMSGLLGWSHDENMTFCMVHIVITYTFQKYPTIEKYNHISLISKAATDIFHENFESNE